MPGLYLVRSVERFLADGPFREMYSQSTDRPRRLIGPFRQGVRIRFQTVDSLGQPPQIIRIGRQYPVNLGSLLGRYRRLGHDPRLTCNQSVASFPDKDLIGGERSNLQNL